MTDRRKARGFTLVELLVAIFVMALLALLSWRGLDGMARAQAYTRQRADEVLTAQATLAQWRADLDRAEQALPDLRALDWDGRGLRLIRRGSATPGAGWFVVGWTLRDDTGAGRWLRWQSPELWRQNELRQAWEQAAQWMQNPTPEQRRREVALLPLAEWRLYYFRNDAWTNPLSSTGAATYRPPIPGLPLPAPDSGIPDGVRLQLVLPAGHALAGMLTSDWVAPNVGGNKS